MCTKFGCCSVSSLGDTAVRSWKKLTSSQNLTKIGKRGLAKMAVSQKRFDLGRKNFKFAHDICLATSVQIFIKI